MVLNLFGHVARPSCNFALRILKHLLAWALGVSGVLSPRHQKLVDSFPTDVRQVRKDFDLDPIVTIYAVCPKCCYLHAPRRTKHSNINEYDARCQYQGRYQGSRPCRAQLTARRVVDGHSVKVPIRPFGYQSFPDFVAGLLSRPGMEDVIDQAWAGGPKEEMKDIWDGSGVHKLKGPDKKPFSNAPIGEGRLVWSLTVDWFNPYQNKQARKKASTGSMLMTCLNLPLSLRNRPENIYLSVIPGPREPETDQMNNFLRPLMNDLIPAWEQGTWFTRTSREPQGRRVRSALCPLVCDMIAARKVAGGAAPRASRLDPFFTSNQQLKDINNISVSSQLYFFRAQVFIIWRINTWGVRTGNG